MRQVKKIVITSTRDNFKAMLSGIVRPGFKAVSFPTIEIKPVSFSLPGGAFDWVVFTSGNAADIFVKKAGKRFFNGKRTAAIGPGTAGSLMKKGLRPDFVHKGPGAEDFVREFSRRFPVSGKKFLLPLSSMAGDVIASGLSGKGGAVRVLTVYRTVKPRVSAKAALSFVNNGPYHFIFFSSPSAFGNFVAIKGLETLLASSHTAAIGPATASAMERYGVTPDITGKTASFKGVLAEIAGYKGGTK